MDTWKDMNAFQRNWRIGELMRAETLKAYHIHWKGISYGVLRVKDESEAQSWLRIANLNEHNWKRLMAPDEIPWENRAEVTIHVEQWHIRYSDTPGGGWEVVEWLRKQGPVNVASVGDQWRVAFGEDAETAPTMAEAACLMAIKAAV